MGLHGSALSLATSDIKYRSEIHMGVAVGGSVFTSDVIGVIFTVIIIIFIIMTAKVMYSYVLLQKYNKNIILYN